MAWRAVVSMQYSVLHPARTSRVAPRSWSVCSSVVRKNALVPPFGITASSGRGARDAWMDGMECGITGPHVLILHEDDRDAGAPCVGEEDFQGVEESRAVSERGVGVFDKAYLCVDDDESL